MHGIDLQPVTTVEAVAAIKLVVSVMANLTGSVVHAAATTSRDASSASVVVLRDLLKEKFLPLPTQEI